jgi:hypothetical protein
VILACHKLRVVYFLYYLFLLSIFRWHQKQRLHQKLLLQRKGKFAYLKLIFLQFRGARVVPENILKKQERDAKVLKALKDSRAKAKTDRAAARKVAAANAEKYYNDAAKADADLVASKRDAKKNGSFFVEAEPKVAFIVRIKG